MFPVFTESRLLATCARRDMRCHGNIAFWKGTLGNDPVAETGDGGRPWQQDGQDDVKGREVMRSEGDDRRTS